MLSWNAAEVKRKAKTDRVARNAPSALLDRTVRIRFSSTQCTACITRAFAAPVVWL
jgi:hypothetical protein